MLFGVKKMETKRLENQIEPTASGSGTLLAWIWRKVGGVRPLGRVRSLYCGGPRGGTKNRKKKKKKKEIKKKEKKKTETRKKKKKKRVGGGQQDRSVGGFKRFRVKRERKKIGPGVPAEKGQTRELLGRKGRQILRR